jgi:hypothetical protein
MTPALHDDITHLIFAVVLVAVIQFVQIILLERRNRKLERDLRAALAAETPEGL